MPDRPWEHGSVVAAVEVCVEAAVGHQLVHEEELAAAVAPADELHQVPVPKPAYDPHLGGILLPPLPGALGNSLDGNVNVHFLQESSVHRAESSFPELLLVGEAVSSHGQLAVAEPLWPGPFLEVVFHGQVVAVQETALFRRRRERQTKEPRMISDDTEPTERPMTSALLEPDDDSEGKIKSMENTASAS